MSKKRKEPDHIYSKTTPSLPADDLKKDAVTRLVEASKGDASGVTDAEVRAMEKQKKGSFLSRIPTWLKAVFFKWWFAGAVCFFFYWGIGYYLNSQWDKILVTGLAMGAVTDMIANNFFRLLETSDYEYHPYSLFFTKKRKLWTLFANVAYALGLFIAVVYTYEGINNLIVSLNPSQYAGGFVPLAVEPLLFGVFYVAYDMAIVMLYRLIRHLIITHRDSVNSGK